MQLYLPVPPSLDLPPQLIAMANSVYGTGEHKNLLTDLRHIGAWVARVIDVAEVGAHLHDSINPK